MQVDRWAEGARRGGLGLSGREVNPDLSSGPKINCDRAHDPKLSPDRTHRPMVDPGQASDPEAGTTSGRDPFADLAHRQAEPVRQVVEVDELGEDPSDTSLFRGEQQPQDLLERRRIRRPRRIEDQGNCPA